MYARLARSIFEARDMEALLRVIQELKAMLRDRVPSLEEFKALFAEIVYTDRLTKSRSLVKYILAAFHRKQQSAITVDYGSMTIEHLVPQSRIGEHGLTEQIVGQMGNFILVSATANTRLGNRPFREKKKVLEQVGFPLPLEIATAEDWGAEQITRRTEALAAEAYNKQWKI